MSNLNGEFNGKKEHIFNALQQLKFQIFILHLSITIGMVNYLMWMWMTLLNGSFYWQTIYGIICDHIVRILNTDPSAWNDQSYNLWFGQNVCFSLLFHYCLLFQGSLDSLAWTELWKDQQAKRSIPFTGKGVMTTISLTAESKLHLIMPLERHH